MRRVLIVAAIAVAALVSVFVVRQLPREGQVIPPAGLAPSVAKEGATPPLAPAPTPADGQLEITATAGPEPLAGAEVRVYRAVPGDAAVAWRTVGRATTGPDGVARVDAPPGAYLVAARAAGLAPAHAVAFRAAGESASHVALVLAPPQGLEGRLDGRAAAEGARVSVSPVLDAIAPGTIAPVEERAGAKVYGDRFRFDGLAPGAYTLHATAGARRAALARVAVPRSGPLAVTLVEGAAPAAAPARPAAGPTGAIEGTVVDPSGAPLSAVRVRVIGRADGAVGLPAVEARTDFEGRYRVDGLEPGRATVLALETGVAVGTSQAVRVAAGRTARADLVLTEAGLLTGRVAGGDGKRPPRGTEVLAVPMKAGLGTLQIARAPVDATGNFTVALPAGDYRVHAAPAEALLTDLRVPPKFAAVASKRTTRTDLTASAAAPESGVVVRIREPGGAPSAGAIVTLARPEDARVALATTAGEDGGAVVAEGMGVAGQPVTVRARNGGRTGEWTGRFPASGELAITLRPGATVDAKLTRRGAAVHGGTVELAAQHVPGAWRPVAVQRFSGDQVAVADLPPEPLRLTFVADGLRATLDVKLEPGEHRDVEVALGSPAEPAGLKR